MAPEVQRKKCYARPDILQASVAPAGRQQLRFMEDKQLTELDRRLIGLSRYLIETSTLAVDNAKQAPAKMSAMVLGSVEYVGGVLKHISEVGSKNLLIFEFADSAWYRMIG